MTENTTNEKTDSRESSQSSQALTQIGRLMFHRRFMHMAMMKNAPEGWHKQQRGPRRVFAVLAKKDGMTNAELAEELDVRPSSVTALVSRLEEEGMVSRQTSESDGRVTVIKLTDEGKKHLAQRREEREGMITAAFNTLSNEDQETLTRLLKKIADNLDEKYPQDREGGPWSGEGHMRGGPHGGPCGHGGPWGGHGGRGFGGHGFGRFHGHDFDGFGPQSHTDGPEGPISSHNSDERARHFRHFGK